MADDILAARVREIAERMRRIEDLQKNGARGQVDLPARPAEGTPDMEPTIQEAIQ